MMVAVRTVTVPKAATANVDGDVAVGRGRTTISRNGLGRPTKALICIKVTLVRVLDRGMRIADIGPSGFGQCPSGLEAGPAKTSCEVTSSAPATALMAFWYCASCGA